MNRDRKVDFVIAGAQKCGTTTLTSILDSHPSLVCCSKKEPHFFSTTRDWRAELRNYEGLFDWQEGALHFEASTTYTFYPHRSVAVWDRLFAYNPEMKILYLVRDPLERITSAYMHAFERGYTELDFEQAVRERSAYLDITRYATQIRPFMDRFGRGSVQILFFEDLIERPRALTQDVLSFLGVDARVQLPTRDRHANRSLRGGRRHHRHGTLPFRLLRRVAPPLWRRVTDPSKRAFVERPELSLESCRRVLRLLSLEIEELERLTGRDLWHWRDPARKLAGSDVAMRG
jgi:hypothetical protein